MRQLVLVWFCVLTGALARPGSQATERAEVPGEIDREIARGKVAAALAEERRRLGETSEYARYLVDEVAADESDERVLYVVLEEARDIAVKVGDIGTAIDAVVGLAESFQVDSRELRAETFRSIPRAAQRGERAMLLAEAWLALAREHVERDEYEAAAAAASEADRLGRRSRDAAFAREVVERRRQIDDLKEAHAKVRGALETARAGRAKPSELTAAGTFLGLLKGDWEEALPFLVDCDDEALASLATREQADPASGAERLSLGDQWLKVARERSGAEARGALWRARHWFLAAYPFVAGLSREILDRRLQAIVSELAPDVIVEPRHLEVRCWMDELWTLRPRDTMTLQERHGILQVENTTGIHSRAKLAVLKPLPEDFAARAEIRGGHSFGLTSADGEDRNISVKLDEQWMTIEISRRRGRVTFRVDGREVRPKYHKSTPTLPGTLNITLMSGQRCEVRSLRLRAGD